MTRHHHPESNLVSRRINHFTKRDNFNNFSVSYFATQPEKNFRLSDVFNLDVHCFVIAATIASICIIDL